MKLASTTFVLLSLAAASAAHAATPFVVTLDDFSRKTIRVDGLNVNELRGTEGEANARATLPTGRLLVLEQVGAPAPKSSTDAFILLQHDGQRLVGRPGALEKDVLHFSTESTGDWKVPLTAVAVIARASGREPSVPTTPLTQDELRLTNGDAVTGIVSESTADRVTCQSADGQSVPVEWANVRQLRFAQAAGEATPSTPAYRLSLVDGTRVGVADLQIDGDNVKVREGERVIELKLNAIRRIESQRGSTQLLANVSPTESSRAGYFPRFNNGSDSDRVVGVAEANGATSAIAARPRSKMVWATRGATAFHARYVIPAGLPRADVSVRVLADDQVVFERSHVRSGETNPAIDVAMKNAKSVTLEVDFGDNYDVQDEFYWLDAALVGATPAK